jgi:hypothetical protein
LKEQSPPQSNTLFQNGSSNSAQVEINVKVPLAKEVSLSTGVETSHDNNNGQTDVIIRDNHTNYGLRKRVQTTFKRQQFNGLENLSDEDYTGSWSSRKKNKR